MTQTNIEAVQSAKELLKMINQSKDAEQATKLQKYMQCYLGGYGEGDVFVGIKVPKLRSLVKPLLKGDLPRCYVALEILLHSPIHEARFCSLILLNHHAQILDKLLSKTSKDSVLYQTGFDELYQIFSFYLQNAEKHVNNWDLVDVSAPTIAGLWLKHNDETIAFKQLVKMIYQPNMWIKRIAIVAHLSLVRKNNFSLFLKLLPYVLDPSTVQHDLLNKALGWVLRELGKQDKQVLMDTLNQYLGQWSSITLSYAIEHMTKDERQQLRLANKNAKHN